MRVLIVDDEDEICDYLKSFFEEYLDRGSELTVECESSGEGALEKLSANEYKLVMVDLKLSRAVSGLDVAREVHEKYSETKVITMSGCIDDEMRKEAKSLGVTEHFEKPGDMNLETLEDRITPIVDSL